MRRHRIAWLVGAAVLFSAVFWANAVLVATAKKGHADLVRIYEMAKRGDYASIRNVGSNHTADELEWFEKDYGKVERFQFTWSKAQFLPGYGAASGRVWRRGRPFSVVASIQSDRVYHVQEFETMDKP